MPRRRCTSAIALGAIVFLCALVVTVWVQFSQGAFDRRHVANDNFVSLTDSPAPSTTMKTEEPSRHKELIEKTHLDENLGSQEAVFVKPLKINPDDEHQPVGSFDPPLQRHHSGHFRDQSAEIWDPHPKYEIDAFGHKLLLLLEHNDKFVAPGLHIVTHHKDHAHLQPHDPKISGCFYTGKVQNDSNSAVAVSLCHGMTGYIRSSRATYFIEPAENFTRGSLDTILHRVKIVPNVADVSNAIPKFQPGSYDSENGSAESHTIIEDDFPEDLVEPNHTVKKRSAVYADNIYYGYQPNQEMLGLGYNDVYSKQSNEYFIRVLIVADSTMLEYHRNQAELHKYILVLMAYVALLFKEPSIGNAISVSLVDIRILNYPIFDSPTSKSSEMLQRFCRWQRRNIPGEAHNIAVLLTRQQICKSDDSCSTLGVAEVSCMCGSSSCTVVRDKGLSTSYTIAHEFGHALGMLHDDDSKCLSYNFGSIRTNNIMSRSTSNDSKPFMWSACSRQFVTDFLDSPKSKCLLKPPSSNDTFSSFTQMLPGDNFELDQQCELEYGPGQTSCTMAHISNPPCVHTWCKNGAEGGCISNYSPWAEGTKCGRNSWCYKRECVPADRSQIIPVDGGWGDWQPWGPCSRTCGGGIKKSERLCNSPIPANGGNYCTGKSMRYVACNTQNCDEDAMDFRQVQCAQFNGITKGVPNLNQDVQWVPKYGLGSAERAQDYCKLYCKPKYSQAYFALKDKVIDGTKCGKSGFGICVNGMCRPGGCDNILDSKKFFDDCGICGGDNSQCRMISGTYNTTADQVSYKMVVRIPRGSSNIHITQHSVGVDENFLALKDGETNKYILNGNQMLMTQEMELEYGRVIIKYSGSKQMIEWIFTTKSKKLQKDLIVEVLSIENLSPPNITYRYMISKDAAPKYDWHLYAKSWTKCSSICEGLQYRRPVCVDLEINQEVPSNNCNPNNKESATEKRHCNNHCSLTWHTVSKSACSPHCGKGYRQVYYKCMKLFKKKQYSAENVDNQHCNVLPKPPGTETCYTPCNTTRWDYTTWSECSRTCGGGYQIRTAKCVDENNRLIDDSHCSNTEKITKQICNVENCPVWFSYKSPCSVSCGGGYLNVTSYCVLKMQLTPNPMLCDQRTRPPSTETCNEHPCARWAATDSFHPCSVTCGEGVETRRFVCKKFDSEEVLDQEYCRSLGAPREETRKCFKECSRLPPKTPYYPRRPSVSSENDNTIYGRYRTFQWVAGEWSLCSQTCDGGTSTQSFTCRNDLGDEDPLMCDPHKKPHNVIRCNDQSCPRWKVGDWSPVCDSMCERHRQVRCMNEKMDTFDDRQCDQQKKPEDTAKCPLDQCPHANLSSTYFSNGDQQKRYKWKVGPWKECSTKCGSGVRTRMVACGDSLNDILFVDSLCKHKTRPKASKGCERYKCKYTWVASHWSTCSKTCGSGLRTRNVTCHKVHQGIVDPAPLPKTRDRIMHKNYCDYKSKPHLEEPCLLSNCGDEYVWQTGEWRQCSKKCGKKGRQFREVTCMNKSLRIAVPQHFCPKSLRPDRKRKCNQWRCLYKSCADIKRYMKTKENKDYSILLHGRVVTIHCYKMDLPEPQEYISLHSMETNFAEIYDRRLLNLNSCPRGGDRSDECHCDQIGHDRSGLTVFWKVRLNITSMQIIGDDFTFSRQVKGMKIPYGTSGDCYSSTSACPQGQFSVDLTGTSFKLASYVIWRKTGRYPSNHISKSNDTLVHGKCGGYCGGCEPDPVYGGLKVEIT